MRHLRPQTQTLSTRLLIYIALPLLIAVALSGILVTGSLEQQFERRMQEDVELIARALQKPVSHALERQRTGSLNSALESALDIGRVYGAYLYDNDGTLLASVGNAQETSQPAAAAGLRSQPRGGGHYGRIDGEAVYSYYVPVRLGGERGTGLLGITRRKADIDTFMLRLRAGGLVFVLALGLVMMATVLVGYRRAAGAAFDRLHASMARIRAGERAHRADLSGPHEVRSVVESLNSMLDSIETTEERLEQSQEESVELQSRLGASEKLASIGQLAAGIAHELGTPLGTVAGRVQRLLRRQPADISMTRELEDVATQVRLMERLVREVLDFGRRDGLRRSRIGSSALLTAAHSALVAGGEIARSARVEVGRRTDAITLSVDPARIEQALVNLLRNAIQASPDGRVRADCTVKGSDVWFVVEDDGPGVPVSDRRRIFEPFVTNRQKGGTGLGLAIVATIANEHGGSVAVSESALGGARFALVLPRISTPKNPRPPPQVFPEVSPSAR